MTKSVESGLRRSYIVRYLGFLKLPEVIIVVAFGRLPYEGDPEQDW